LISLGNIIDSILKVGRPINSIEGVEDAWVDIHCIQEISEPEKGIPDVEFSFNNREVVLLGKLGLPLVITVSSVNP
jgi:hypothetical protein